MTADIGTMVPLGTLFDIGAGKSVTPTSRHGEPRFPFLRTSNIYWGRLDLTDVDTMHFSAEELEAKGLKKGDLLVCEGGDIGRSAIWNGAIERCSFQNHLHRLRPKTTEVIPHFYMYYLQAGFTQLGLYEGAGNKTTIPNLSRSRLAGLLVPHPRKHEQCRIAALLATAQKAAEIEDTVARVVRELKVTAMRMFFTRGLRNEAVKDTEIGPIPSGWEPRRLESCCQVVMSSLSYADLAVLDNSTDKDSLRAMGIKVSDMNLTGNECVITHANLERRISLALAKKAKLVPSQTVVFPKRGAAIATNKKRMTSAWTVLDPNLIGVRPQEGLNPRFLFHWFQQFDLRTITEPGPTPQLNKKNLLPLVLPVPKDEGEQSEIADSLDVLDQKIEHHERKRVVLDELFQSLLGKLMVGRLHVGDVDIDTSGIAAC